MVVLLSQDGVPVGASPKATVHTEKTPLHLAFSCYVISNDGKVLLTRRSLGKRTWAGVWTNSFCGHPYPGEELQDAVQRRANDELRIEIKDIRLVLEDFRYCAIDPSGTVENEVCPVFVARTSSVISPNPDEVMEWCWVDPDKLRKSVDLTPFVYSPWLRAQTPLLLEADAFALQDARA